MANKVYTIDLDENSLAKLEEHLSKMEQAFSGREFKEFLLEKCVKARDEIMLESDIAHIENENGSANQEKVDKYVNANKTSIKGDIITLSNNAHLSKDELTHFFDEDYKSENYSRGLSLAELVEYGAGLVGAGSSKGTGDEWEYQVNPGRDYNDGWVYKGDSDKDRVHTMGVEGKYIYYKLANAIEQNIDNWVEEYLDNKLGSEL